MLVNGIKMSGLLSSRTSVRVFVIL